MEKDQPRIHRVVGAIDCGQVVNPNILEQQIQGGVIYGLTNALLARSPSRRAGGARQL